MVSICVYMLFFKLQILSMKYVVLLVILTSCLAFDKEVMLKENKISKETIIANWGTACEECESLVKRFNEAAKDPAKMAELKTLLNILCHETSYVDECRIFVSKLDVIIKKLEPYILSIHFIFHPNYAFHRIGLLFAKRAMNKLDGMVSGYTHFAAVFKLLLLFIFIFKDLVCDECQFAASELKTLVEDSTKQAAIREFFSQNLCKHMSSYQGMCDMLLEQFLPELFQELDALLQDPKKACIDVGFCGRIGPGRQLTKDHIVNLTHSVGTFSNTGKTLYTRAGHILMTCLECKIMVDEGLEQLISNRKLISKNIQELFCLHILPTTFTDSCNDFISLYMPTVLYMTFEQFSSPGVCKYLHTCDQISLNNIAQLSSSEAISLRYQSWTGFQEYLKNVTARTGDKELKDFILNHLMQNTCHKIPRQFTYLVRFFLHLHFFKDYIFLYCFWYLNRICDQLYCLFSNNKSDVFFQCDRLMSGFLLRLFSVWTKLLEHGTFCSKQNQLSRKKHLQQLRKRKPTAGMSWNSGSLVELIVDSLTYVKVANAILSMMYIYGYCLYNMN
uniref:Saposin B-type domain-containing protein n=1 Tax=Heterorhabditis bacteriophora TaxID=37862 RepID=A0A1I7WLW9_HETBA